MPNNLMHAFQGPVGRARESLGTMLMKCAPRGLVNAVDAGSDESAPASATTWLNDGSWGVPNYDRGTTTGADATDPTFNGTAGQRTENEYFSFDGGDYFESPTVPAWANEIYKNNAIFTILAWVYINTSVNAQAVMGHGGGSDAGWILDITSTPTLRFGVFDDAGGTAFQIASEATISEDAWHVVGITMFEAAVTHYLLIDYTHDDETGSYTSPSSIANSVPVYIGAGGAGGTPIESGGRIAGVAVWDRALNLDEYDFIRMMMGARFGI